MRNAEAGCNPWQVALTTGGMGRKNVRITTRNRGNQPCDIFSKLIFVGRVVCNQNLINASNCGDLTSDSVYTAARNQYVDIAANGLSSRLQTEVGLQSNASRKACLSSIPQFVIWGAA